MRQDYSVQALGLPAVEPVGLAEVKTFLRITHDSEDAVLTGYISAARMFCENYTDKSFITRAYRLVLEHVPKGRVVEIPRSPLIDINSVKTYAANGAVTVFNADLYEVDCAQNRLCLKDGAVLPSGLRSYNAVEIEFTAGYGAAAEDVPEALRQAILIKTAQLYEYRAEDAAPGGFDLIASLLRPYKRMRIS